MTPRRRRVCPLFDGWGLRGWKGAAKGDARLLAELADSGIQRRLVVGEFSFRDRPDAGVLVLPEGASRMDEEDFEDRSATVEENSRTLFGRHIMKYNKSLAKNRYISCAPSDPIPMYRLLLPTVLFLCLSATGKAQFDCRLYGRSCGWVQPAGCSITPTFSGPATDAQYQWNLGNGNSATVSNPQAVYTTIGSYTVTLTVTASGRTLSASHVVTVYAAPTVAFTASTNLVCSTPVNFTAIASGTITGYLWDFGDAARNRRGRASRIPSPPRGWRR